MIGCEIIVMIFISNYFLCTDSLTLIGSMWELCWLSVLIDMSTGTFIHSLTHIYKLNLSLLESQINVNFKILYLLSIERQREYFLLIQS